MVFVSRAYLSAGDMHITQFLLLRLLICACEPRLLHCAHNFSHPLVRAETPGPPSQQAARGYKKYQIPVPMSNCFEFSTPKTTLPFLPDRAYAHSSILPSAFGNVSISLTLSRYCIMCLLLVRKPVRQLFFPCMFCLFPRAARHKSYIRGGDPQHIVGCFCCNGTCGYFTPTIH